MKNYNEIMSKKLKSYRGAALLTQAEAAKILKIHRITLARYENAPADASINTLAEMCNLYGCNVRDLLTN